MTIGQKLSPVLEEIENTLWEFEATKATKPDYTKGGFRAALKIFMSAMLDKLWELQEVEKMEGQDRLNMAHKCGEAVREVVKIYTGIDSYKIYDK